MELRDLRVALRRNWLVALVAFLVCVLAGGYFALSIDETYQATATVSVEPDPDSAGDGGSGVQVTNFLVPAVVERLGSAPYRELARAQLTAELASASVNVSPSVESGTGIVKITVEAEEEATAVEWANALAAVTVAAQDTTPTESAAGEPEPLSGFLEIALVEPASGAQPAGGANRTAILVASVVLGLLAAVFSALVAFRTRRALDPAEEVRARLGLPVLAVVPRTSRLRRQPLAATMSEHVVPELEEAFRRLRTGIELRLARERPDAIAVTSLEAGEGKTTVTAGLALALASVGHDVVLLDADLRRPAVHTALGVPMGHDGVSDWARNDIHPVLRRHSVEHLGYLTAGVPDRHPADVTALALSRALAAYRAPGRLVLLDAPPLEGVAETPLVLNAATHTILVVDASSSRIAELASVVEEMRAGGIGVLGVVVNRAKKPRRGNNAYYAFVAQGPARFTQPTNGSSPPEPVEIDAPSHR